METLTKLVYWNDGITQHPFHTEVGSTLYDISERDYPGTDYFDSAIEALDMDCYEEKQSQFERKPTMDAVIGIKQFDGHFCNNPRLLLVELRIGYKTIAHLSTTELKGKVDHTRNLLVGSNLSSFNIFVFTPAVAPHARSWFSRQEKANHWFKLYVAWSTEEFKQNVLAPQNYPYQPYTDVECLKSDATNLINEGDTDGFYIFFDSKMKFAINFQYNNPNEYDAIIEVLKDIWAIFTSDVLTMNEHEILCKELIEEDYKDRLL